VLVLHLVITTEATEETAVVVAVVAPRLELPLVVAAMALLQSDFTSEERTWDFMQ
jgi:hypothetical protein